MTDLSMQAVLRAFVAKERGLVQFPWEMTSNTRYTVPDTQKSYNKVALQSRNYSRLCKASSGSNRLSESSSTNAGKFVSDMEKIEAGYSPRAHHDLLHDHEISLYTLAASATACDVCSLIYEAVQKVDRFWAFLKDLYDYEDDLSLKMDIENERCRVRIRLKKGYRGQILEICPGWRLQDQNNCLRLFTEPGKFP